MACNSIYAFKIVFRVVIMYFSNNLKMPKTYFYHQQEI